MIDKKSLHGFTIIELAIVITILSIIAASALKVAGRSKESEKIAITKERQEYILRAIERYVGNATGSANGAGVNYLPCPADIKLAFDAPNFGIGIGSGNITVDDCAGTETETTLNIYAGAVPIDELGISPKYMFDGWNRRFTYVVDGDLTEEAGFDDPRISTGNVAGYHDSEPNIMVMNGAVPNFAYLRGATTNEASAGTIAIAALWTLGDATPDDGIFITSLITLAQAQGESVPVASAFAIISHGANGHGAYRYKGGATPITASNAGTREGDNFIDGTNNPLTSIYNLYQDRGKTTPANYFDDIIVSRTKWELQKIPLPAAP